MLTHVKPGPLLILVQVADVGLELPELALLRARLAQGEGLQEQLDEALGAEGEERASIASLKALQQQASSCGLALSGGDVVCVFVCLFVFV